MAERAPVYVYRRLIIVLVKQRKKNLFDSFLQLTLRDKVGKRRWLATFAKLYIFVKLKKKVEKKKKEIERNKVTLHARYL